MSGFFDKVAQRLDKMDAADRRRQFRLLADEIGFLESVFDTLKEGVLAVSPGGDLLYANAAAEAVGLARKAYDIAAKSYKIGKGTITEMNDAQLTLTQASLQQSQAVYNFIVAKSNLEKTLGYDFIDDEGNVDLDNM